MPADFSKIQKTFTSHIRDPQNQPAPADVEDRRMDIYRGLFFRNVESFMANSFPVLRKITPDAQWQAMIRDYFRDHQARTPLFPKMPQEFLQYLQEERGERAEDFPFLLELAHYEWMEAELSFDNRSLSTEGVDVEGDLLGGCPVLNELIMPLAYRFPVHRIGPDFLPDSVPEQPTYLLIYRDRKDKIGFIELNPVAARLIEILQQGRQRTGRDVLEQIADEMQHPEPEVVVNGGLDIMESMRRKDIILGTREG